MRVFSIAVVAAVLALATVAVLVAGAAAVAAVVLPSVRQARENSNSRTEMRSIDFGAAKSVQAEFHIGAGSLPLRGGPEQLMDAAFT